MAAPGRAASGPAALRTVTLAIAILFCLVVADDRAATADDTTAQATRSDAVFDPDAWRFRGTAYGWPISVSADMTASGQTVDVDASFIQLVQKSDSLIGFMGNFEVNKGPVGFCTDLVWAKLGFDHSTTHYRNPIACLRISTTTNTALTYSLAIVEADGVYEVACWPGSPGSFTALDGLLGFRYWNNSFDVSFDLTGSIYFSFV